MQPQQVQGHLGRALLYFGARPRPVEAQSFAAALPRQPCKHQAYRLFRAAPAWPRDTGGAYGQIRLQARAAADGHGLGDLGTYRAVSIEQILWYAQQIGIDAVVVGHDAAAEPLADPRHFA